MTVAVAEIMGATVMGIETIKKRLKVTLDNSYPAGGYDISSYLSSDFTEIYDWSCKSPIVADNGYKFDLVGTELSTGGLDASATIKVAGVWGNTTPAGVLPEITPATDVSAVILTITVEGK